MIKDNEEYFLVRLRTDEMLQNRGLCELYLGKYKTDEKKYYLTILKANKKLKVSTYFSLLTDNALSSTQFEEISLDKIKEKLEKNQNMLQCFKFKGCEELKQWVKEKFIEN